MIIRKSPEEIDKIAAAGQILARCLTMLRGKARPGVTTGDLDEAAERFIRSQGADAGLQGLPRLPGLDLRLAELDGRARHPGPLQARAAGTSSRSTWAWCSTAGWPTPPSRSRSARSARWPRRLLETTRASLFEAVEQCRPGQPPRRRLPRGASSGWRPDGFSRGPLARGPRGGPRHARGSADPELRRARHRRRARGGHGAGGRADGERRATTRFAWPPTTGRSTRRTALWPPISSTRWPSPRRVRGSSPPGTSRRRGAPPTGRAGSGRVLSLLAAGYAARSRLLGFAPFLFDPTSRGAR